MARFKSKKASVRRSGDVLKVRIECDGAIIFKASAPLNSPSKVSSLLNVLRSKGLSFPKESEGWGW